MIIRQKTNIIKRLGIIKSIDVDNKIIDFLGYAKYIGQFDKKIEEFDMLVLTDKAILENNNEEVWLDDYSYFSDSDSIDKLIEEYKKDGYVINNIN